MRRARAWIVRLTGLFDRTRRERELAAELDAHVDLHVADNLKAGMTSEEARRQAFIRLGGIEATKERYRERRGLPGLDSLVRDLRFAGRMLHRNPLFSAVVVVTLAAGIGLNTTLFALVDAVLLRPLPVERPDRLVDIYTSSSNGDTYATSSYPDYLDFRARNRVFSDIIAYTPSLANLRTGERTRLAVGEIVTGNYFEVLGVEAQLGRMLLPEDDRPGAPRVAVVSHAFWRRELDAEAGAVGRTLSIKGQTYTIVGVAPERFTGMVPVLSSEVWTAMAWHDDIQNVGIQEMVPSPGDTRLERRGHRWLLLRGRLNDEEDADLAGEQLQLIMNQLAEEYPATNRNRQMTVLETKDVHLFPAADPLLQSVAAGLMLVVGLVLLVACTNVAGMMLARASGRRREFGVRLAVGASRGRLVQQLLTESALLAVLGAGGGVGLAWILLRAIDAFQPPTPLPLEITLLLDARVLLFTSGITVAAGLLTGLTPALWASRSNLAGDLKGGAAAAGRARWTLRDGLVATQLAVSVVLLVTAGLLARSITSAEGIDLGFDADGLAGVAASPAAVGYDPAQSAQFMDRAKRRVEALPGVDSVALARRMPLDQYWDQDMVLIPGHHAAGDTGDQITATNVSPEFFSTLDVPIVAGRNFTATDTRDSRPVVIINQAMAARYWPDEGAVGKRFRVRAWDGLEYEVVGVVADYKVRTIGERPRPYIHRAIAQNPIVGLGVVLARGRGDAAVLAAAIERELRTLEPELVFMDMRTMRDRSELILLPTRLAARGLSGVGIAAVLLAAVGLYGVIAYSVGRRTREIGIRMALGAQPRSVLALIVRQGFAIVALGMILGLPTAFLAARLLSSALYDVPAADPLAWGGAVVVLLVVSALANLVPARRAAALQPSRALRVE